MSTPAVLGIVAVFGLGWLRGPAIPLATLTTGRPGPWILLRPAAVVRAVTIVVPIGYGLRVAPLATALGAVVVLGGVRLVRSRRASSDRAREAASLPQALELCIVTLGAGGTVTDCLRTLSESRVEPTASVARFALRSIEDGAVLDDALLVFQRRLGPGHQPLTGALRLAAEQGGAVAALLDRLAIEARAERRRAGELRARRLSVLLLLPLVMFSLPSVVIGVLVPLALVAFRNVA